MYYVVVNNHHYIPMCLDLKYLFLESLNASQSALGVISYVLRKEHLT